MTDLELLISDETQKVKNSNLNMIKNVVSTSAKHLKLDGNFECSITVVDNQKIREINKEYRKIDKVTDVISFAIEDEDEEDFGIVFRKDQNPFPRQLGDIFISLQRAQEQAEDYGHSFERELAFLVVHGFLHLNGYDHQTKNEEKEMFQLQEKILKEYGLER